MVLMQRTDPCRCRYKNNEPPDFILPAFTLVLASMRVACVGCPVSDSLGCSFNFSLEVCVGRNVDSRAAGEHLAVALSSCWTGAASLKVYPSKIVLASALCVYM